MLVVKGVHLVFVCGRRGNFLANFLYVEPLPDDVVNEEDRERKRKERRRKKKRKRRETFSIYFSYIFFFQLRLLVVLFSFFFNETRGNGQSKGSRRRVWGERLGADEICARH